jgi:predicted secreted Zn-dependent protease
MKKRAVVFLLLTACTGTSFAAEDRVKFAYSNRELPLRGKSTVLAPVVTEKYEYYEVCGTCEKELQCDIRNKCIRWNDGRKYDSVTQWHVKWDYGHDRGPAACTADSFRVTLEITFRYPKWVPPADAHPSLVDKWNNYMENLVMHENVHRDFAVDAAEELSRAVADLPPAATCAELDRKVQALSRERMKKLDKEQSRYDEITRHGVLQGAVFR